MSDPAIVADLEALPLVNLSTEDLAAIATTRWPRFGEDLTILIARAWNAGACSRLIARAMGCSPGSVSMTIGKLRQIGVHTRLPPVRNAGDVNLGSSAARRDFQHAQRVIDVRRPNRGNVTRQLLGDPPPGRTPWSAP